MAVVKGDWAINRKLDVQHNARFRKGVEMPYLEIIDSKASGTAGGDFNANVWRTRDLTDTVFDDFAVSVDLSASAGDGAQITLNPGIYYIEASCPALQVDEHTARLADVTDQPGTFADTVIQGTSEFAPDSEKWRIDDAGGSIEPLNVHSAAQTRSIITGKFQLTRVTTLEIQHRCNTTQTVDGMGSDGGFYIT
ncbi:MAG: hypothetical protein MN733_07010, partial [Nitrososphaera sp.]|nr:hypothetical protein [Nitrososphaera sp.]